MRVSEKWRHLIKFVKMRMSRQTIVDAGLSDAQWGYFNINRFGVLAPNFASEIQYR